MSQNFPSSPFFPGSPDSGDSEGTGTSGMLQSMASQGAGHNLATEQPPDYQKSLLG